MLDITITNIPIMGIMATVITRPLGLATVTAEVIIAVILLMDGIMVGVIRLMVDIMAVAIMAAGLEAFTVVIDKNGNIDG
ncbi:MAG: hypothetical protein WCP96_02720 [Methylococcaceae bacterium]